MKIVTRNSVDKKEANKRLFTIGKWGIITRNLLRAHVNKQRWSRLILALYNNGTLQLNKWRIVFKQKHEIMKRLRARNTKIRTIETLGKWSRLTKELLARNGI